jgi:hypothetical protein
MFLTGSHWHSGHEPAERLKIQTACRQTNKPPALEKATFSTASIQGAH